MPSVQENTLAELARNRAALTRKLAVVGLDGFVDKIMHPVDKRTGKGEDFVPFPNIAAFGQRIVEAAGKSANIEIFPKLEKLGGNGPIMAEALLSTGVGVRETRISHARPSVRRLSIRSSPSLNRKKCRTCRRNRRVDSTHRAELAPRPASSCSNSSRDK